MILLTFFFKEFSLRCLWKVISVRKCPVFQAARGTPRASARSLAAEAAAGVRHGPACAVPRRFRSISKHFKSFWVSSLHIFSLYSLFISCLCSFFLFLMLDAILRVYCKLSEVIDSLNLEATWSRRTTPAAARRSAPPRRRPRASKRRKWKESQDVAPKAD